jgi:hypothetical protein
MKLYLNNEEKSVDPRLLYDILRGLKALCDNTRTATGMDGTLPHCSFENLKPVEISKNCFNII